MVKRADRLDDKGIYTLSVRFYRNLDRQGCHLRLASLPKRKCFLWHTCSDFAPRPKSTAIEWDIFIVEPVTFSVRAGSARNPRGPPRLQPHSTPYHWVSFTYKSRPHQTAQPITDPATHPHLQSPSHLALVKLVNSVPIGQSLPKDV
jgi:hypothetical protein